MASARCGCITLSKYFGSQCRPATCPTPHDVLPEALLKKERQPYRRQGGSSRRQIAWIVHIPVLHTHTVLIVLWVTRELERTIKPFCCTTVGPVARIPATQIAAEEVIDCRMTEFGAEFVAVKLLWQRSSVPHKQSWGTKSISSMGARLIHGSSPYVLSFFIILRVS
jgi:hypothetical protein